MHTFGVVADAQGNGTRCWIRVKLEGHEDWLWFQHTFESREVALIVRAAIDRAMDERIKEIKKAAYERGWKANRDPDLRIDNFNGCINGSMVGW